MKYTQIPATTFAELQLNAGVLATNFVPSTGTLEPTDIIGATSGGIKVSCIPTFKDYGSGVDNAPLNTKELKQIDSYECKIGGTFVTVDTGAVCLMVGAADIDSTDTTKVTPRLDLSDDDFSDIWFVGDYSDKNGDTNGGFVAIHLSNALSTSGFSMQSADKDKASFAAEFTGHVAIATQTVVPMEFYIKAGTAEPEA